MSPEDPRPDAWRSAKFAVLAATALVIVDRARVQQSLGSAFAAMSVWDHVAALALAIASSGMLLALLDRVVVGGWPSAGRPAPTVSGAVVATYLMAFTVEPLVGTATDQWIFGSGAALRAAWSLAFLAAMLAGSRVGARVRDTLPSPAAATRVAMVIGGLCGAAGYLGLAATSRSAHSLDGFVRAGPNVLVVAWDGVGADRTTVYAPERDTTPHLARIAERALVADNAYPLSCTTYGSVTALLTGRSPLATRMIYFPDRLLGADAFRHLPKLLVAAGYRTAAIGAPGYVDPSGMGFRGGFHVTNHLGPALELPGLDTAAGPLVDGLRLWLQDLSLQSRRILVQLSGRRVVSTFRQTYIRDVGGDDDAWRVDRFKEHVRAAGPRPWFAYVHLMGTHGPFFPVPESAGPPIGHRDDDRAFDLALRQADARLGDMLAFLETQGALADTIVAVVSDHAEHHACGRVPFVVQVPDPARWGRVPGTVNLTDLEPTLIGLLGGVAPSYVEGLDLLQELPAPGRTTVHPWDVVGDRIARAGENLLSVAVRRCGETWVVPLDGGPVQQITMPGHLGSECDDLHPLDEATVRNLAQGALCAHGWACGS